MSRRASVLQWPDRAQSRRVGRVDGVAAAQRTEQRRQRPARPQVLHRLEVLAIGRVVRVDVERVERGGEVRVSRHRRRMHDPARRRGSSTQPDLIVHLAQAAPGDGRVLVVPGVEASSSRPLKITRRRRRSAAARSSAVVRPGPPGSASRTAPTARVAGRRPDYGPVAATGAANPGRDARAEPRGKARDLLQPDVATTASRATRGGRRADPALGPRRRRRIHEPDSEHNAPGSNTSPTPFALGSRIARRSKNIAKMMEHRLRVDGIVMYDRSESNDGDGWF